MNRPVVLDTSFLVALEREPVKGELGPARRFLPSLRGRRLVVSIVTVEELLEGATDEAAALASLQLVATAESINADVGGADRIAFERLGPGYLRFR